MVGMACYSHIIGAFLTIFRRKHPWKLRENVSIRPISVPSSIHPSWCWVFRFQNERGNGISFEIHTFPAGNTVGERKTFRNHSPQNIRAYSAPYLVIWRFGVTKIRRQPMRVRIGAVIWNGWFFQTELVECPKRRGLR